MREQTLPERPATAAATNGEVALAAHAPPPPAPTPDRRPPAGAPSRGRAKAVGAGLAFVALAAAVLAFLLGVPVAGLGGHAREQTVLPEAPLAVKLVRETPHTLAVPEDVRVALGIRKGKEDAVATVQAPKATNTRPLVLSGSTALDPTRLSRIRARFAPAEVVEIARRSENSTKTGETEQRELRPGDFVRKGDVLAVFYSVDVGSKKNDLIDALVQLKMDKDILDRALAKSEVVPEVFVLNARRNVETDRNAIARALNTLKTWGIAQEDIDAVYAEAEEISKRQGARDHSKDDQWPRVVLKAPEDGTIVERNVALHETVVDNTVNLFQIARVDRLVVVANASEEDLPTLLKLPEHLKRWTVRTVGADERNGIAGPVDEISYLIDVNQHSAVVKGHIDNPPVDEGNAASPARRLRAGQYVTATINLPPPDGVVEVPVGAVVDDGRQCVVFVQPDPAKAEYTLRRVEVTHRFEKTVYVRSALPEGQPARTPEEEKEGLLPREPLRPGEKVLTRGVLELKKELEDRESESEK
jgi:cobalt-zinc-cadmium efflux system membrane fusion protein